jgi:hypothetical protein
VRRVAEAEHREGLKLTLYGGTVLALAFKITERLRYLLEVGARMDDKVYDVHILVTFTPPMPRAIIPPMLREKGDHRKDPAKLMTTGSFPSLIL